MTNLRIIITVTVALAARVASAQSSLVCPAVSPNTGFSSTAFSTDCAGSSDPTNCTSKAGVMFDATQSVLSLPTTAGNFQTPPAADVQSNVYFAAVGDFDHDGWEDFVGATDADQIYINRNQTITCGTGGCSGTSSAAPTATTITGSWWNTLSNVRPAAFRQRTTTGGTATPLKASVAGITNGTLGVTPMVSGDFDGDGWTDFVEISGTYVPETGGSSDLRRWPTAARLFLNTKNCHQTTATTNIQSCGIGTLCTGQTSNGACSLGSTGTALVNGSPWPGTADQDLSCTNTSTCPYYFPTFATYDMRTGAATTSAGTSTTTPTTSYPGDFGPVGHPAQNMVALDWDGDGDIDILYGHAAGTCPTGLCTTIGAVFYSGIDVWKNDCAQSAQWNPVTKSCAGHIPVFTHTGATCTGASCSNPDVLIPSTAHNSTTIAPTSNLGFDVTYKETPAFAFVDIDKDGDLDLVIGSPGCCTTNVANRLRVFRGTSNNTTTHTLDTANPISLSTSNSTYKGFEGGLTAVSVYDFSLDGYPDIVGATDSFAYDANNGGRTRYWQNTGNPSTPFGTSWPTCSATPSTCAGCSATCNPNPTRYLSESCTTTGNNTCTAGTTSTHGYTEPTYPDFDMGLMINYDNDPSATKDFVMTNGNTSNEFYIFPNRASAASVVACGTVASGTLATPAAEVTISGACITPTASVPSNTGINYFLTNDRGTTWQLACTQLPTGIYSALPATGATLIASGQCCATFANTVNHTIEWKAEFDSNTSDMATNGVGAPNGCAATGIATPSVASVTANYTYTASAPHYKAGVIVSDGVTYVGSFTQPGNRGHFLGISADFSTQYYDAGAQLDAQSTRFVYTSDATGLAPTRLAFSPSSPPASLQARIGAASASVATTVINWVLSARFGITGSGVTQTKLGAIIDSTPAILQKPFKPYWYSYLSSADRGLYDTFATSQATRIPLVMFASMDGMIHAVYSISSSIGDARNGTEAWAFVPPSTAASMTTDYTASCPSGVCSSSTLSISAYPDGSPALVDYKKSDGTIATAALVGDGAGGSSLSALDVTQTVTPTGSSSNTTQGPTPMWSVQPGTNPGNATSKPGVARTKIAGVETFVVVAGSGINSSDSTKGVVVGGYNLQTGALLWKYQMNCALTSDITVFETDDTGEPGLPAIDGFADRAVFADSCGNVYKINPGQDLAGGWLGNAGYGPIALATLNGVARTALFSTATTASAIGGARPIVGTIGARVDSTTDMVLFFGTGGLESQSAALQNEFYAVYAKSGAIRSKLTGTCTSGKCQKFYGGVVVTPDTVYLTRSTDAVIGGGSCDFGSTSVQGYNVNTLNSSLDVSMIGGQSVAASAGPLFGDAGALYFSTVAGKIERVGSPGAATAGAGNQSTLSNMGAADTGGTATAFTLLGWREVL